MRSPGSGPNWAVLEQGVYPKWDFSSQSDSFTLSWHQYNSGDHRLVNVAHDTLEADRRLHYHTAVRWRYAEPTVTAFVQDPGGRALLPLADLFGQYEDLGSGSSSFRTAIAPCRLAPVTPACQLPPHYFLK